MHTPECNDALDWWPQGAPTDIDVSALPTEGALTNPVRLLVDGNAPWLGIWGKDFSGLRVGFAGNGQTFPAVSGVAIPYPIRADGSGVDLYLSKETGGTGECTVARFKTREAALAWGGRPGPTSGGPASGLLPNRSNPRSEGGIDSLAEVPITWAISGFMYATVKNEGPGVVMIGSDTGVIDFPLAVGASLNGYVGNATGFIALGLSAVTADTLSILEYGRS